MDQFCIHLIPTNEVPEDKHGLFNGSRTRFILPACHLPVLDGFYQYIQATIHFPQSSAVD